MNTASGKLPGSKLDNTSSVKNVKMEDKEEEKLHLQLEIAHLGSLPQSQSGTGHLARSALVPPLSPGRTAAPFGNYTNEIRGELNLQYYLPLYQAARNGDWERAKNFIERDPNALTEIISLHKMNVLHVASVCGHWKFVEKLLELMSEKELEAQENIGRTALHFAALDGSLDAAKKLVAKNPALTQIPDIFEHTPLFQAASWARPEKKEIVKYLSMVTSDEHSRPFTGPLAADLIMNITAAGHYDICLYLIHRYSHLATIKDKYNRNILTVLSEDPSAFKSGSKLGIWESIIYPIVSVEVDRLLTQSMRDDRDTVSSLNNFRHLEELLELMKLWTCPTQVLQKFKRLFWKTAKLLGIKKVYDAKRRHTLAQKLVTSVCEHASNHMNNERVIEFFVASRVMNSAASVGLIEIISACLHYFPDLIWPPMHERNMIHVAVQHRQEKTLNLIYAMYDTSATNIIMTSVLVDKYNTIWHLAAKLAPHHALNSISGSAFQMQREIQWFKEVGTLVHPSMKEIRNFEGKTAQEVFTEEHRELVQEAEKWMKDTSNSGMVVSTLIATVVFAAAFTVPGGNQDNGIPIFLDSNSFMLFAISDAVALFSSITSLLIFLSILTSRYAEEDFLHSLPKRIIIGLASIFFAIASMMIAFGAALSIVVGERLKGGSIPFTFMLASIPATIFAMLQLPLFMQMVRSTYGRGIFHQSQPMQ